MTDFAALCEAEGFRLEPVSQIMGPDGEILTTYQLVPIDAPIE